MLGERLKKLILFRLLFATLLLYAPAVFSDIDSAVFLGAAVFICLISAIYVIWLVTRRRLQGLAILQMVGDGILETYLVYFTGGAESAFASLYVLSILEGALVMGDQGVVTLITVFSCFCYFIGSLGAFLTIRSALFLVHDPLYFLYVITVNIAILVLTGFLSRRLSKTVDELQNKLQLLERLSSLGEVVSKIAHEIRNPLSSIRTAAEVMNESLKGRLNEQQEKMLSIVDGESERLMKTLARILSYSKQVEFHPKMLFLDPLINRVLAVAQTNSLVHSTGVLVERKYDIVKTRIYADEEQVVGALINLMLNAYQAMPQGGILRIEADGGTLGTKLKISDSGCGIPRDMMKEIFAPFKTSKKGGTGLGLAEVHKVVTLHEGKIHVESEPGKGTTFHLYFPKP